MISSEKAWQDVGVCDDVVYNIYIDRHRYRIIKDISIYTCELLIYCIYIYMLSGESCAGSSKRCAGALVHHQGTELSHCGDWRWDEQILLAMPIRTNLEPWQSHHGAPIPLNLLSHSVLQPVLCGTSYKAAPSSVSVGSGGDSARN